MWSVYIRKGKVFVPSQFKTEAGFYLSGEPICVADLSDRDGIKRSIAQTLNHGCPVIPTPPVSRLDKWAVLRHAGVASVAAFEKGTSCWVIKKDDVSFRYGRVGKISPRGWEAEPKNPKIMSNNSPLDVIAEEIANKIYASARAVA